MNMLLRRNNVDYILYNFFYFILFYLFERIKNVSKQDAQLNIYICECVTMLRIFLNLSNTKKFF